MKKNKKLIVNKKEVERLFNSFKRDDLLEDRAEYSEDDLQSAYPHLNKKEAKLLYIQIQRWKYGKLKRQKNT